MDALSCSEKNYTVIFVNGIFKSKDEANANAKALQGYLGAEYKGESVVVRAGYNPTHLAGAGDLAQAASQLFGYSVSDFDLQTILKQIHPEVTTRKLFLVGHSQGAFYTNAMYDYFLARGVPKESVGIYNVGTPAAMTAGGGKYITANQDLMIRLLTDTARKVGGQPPLPPNADMPLLVEDFSSAFPGHSFAGAYLKSAPERIVGEISSGLAQLKASGASAGDCFTVPQTTLSYRAQQIAFSVADPTAYVVRTGVVLTYQGGVVVVHIAIGALQKGYAWVQGAFGVASAPQPRSTDDTVKDFEVIKSLYGSSLEGSDVKDLQANRQGAAVATALRGRVAGSQTGPSTETGDSVVMRYISRHSKKETAAVVQSTPSEEPTPLSPATTTPVGLFTASTTPPTLRVIECAYSIKKEFCLVPTREVHIVWNAPPAAVQYKVFVGDAETTVTTNTAKVLLADNASSTVRVVAYDSIGTAATSSAYSLFVATRPLVISEIGWAGTNASTEDQWMELQNRTDYWLDFAHIALVTVGENAQRIPLNPMSDFYATFAAVTGHRVSVAPTYTFVRSDGVFRNSKIYTSTSYTPLVPFVPLSASGEELLLVWEVGSTTLVLDKTPPVSACEGWCGGAVGSTTRYTPWGVEKSNLSMERKSAAAPGELVDSWASNDGYYFTASPVKDREGNTVLGTPFEENSKQAPSVGFSCLDSPDIVRPGDHIQSTFSECLFYTGFAASSVTRRVGFYVGVEGSSTPLYQAQDARNEVLFRRSRMGDEVPVAAGTPMFMAVTTEPLFSQFSVYLTRGAAEHLSPPSHLYRVVPFVFGP